MGITGKDIKMDSSNNVKNGIVPTETNKSGISSNSEIGNQIVPQPFSKTSDLYATCFFLFLYAFGISFALLNVFKILYKISFSI